MKTKKGLIYVVMGVSGSGKSTIAPMLAEKLGLPFFDGDQFHPKENVQKMASGTPLNDQDRHAWLLALNELARKHAGKGAVIVCSALKKRYRKQLAKDLKGQVQWIFLQGSFDLILSRLMERKGHFMPTELLRSQFETLEPPKKAIAVSIAGKPEEILEAILSKLDPASGGYPDP